MSTKDNKAYTALDQSSMPNFNSSWVNYKGRSLLIIPALDPHTDSPNQQFV